MNFKKIIACAAAAAICSAFTACGDSKDSSSKAEVVNSAVESGEVRTESETNSSAEQVGITDYDVNGDFRAFDTLKETYGGGYTANLQIDYSGNVVDMTATISGDKAYMSSVSSGMKSYNVVPGDGNIYCVYEATTTYSVEEAEENSASQLDILFGATSDFASAEIDEATNTVYEHYSLNKEVSASEGEIIYGFDGASYELTEIQIAFEGVEIPDLYKVISIGEADTSVLEVPDISAYTKI